MMSTPLRLVASLACTYLTLGAPQAQQPQQFQNEGRPIFSAKVDLVMLSVSVLDSDDLPVEELLRDDFVVVEDGVEQELALFLSPEEAGLDVALLVDMSESMERMEDAARSSALNFLDQLSGDDCIFLLRFKHITGPGMWGGPMNPDLRAAISETAMKGGTALRDAVADGFRRLEHDADRCWPVPSPSSSGQEVQRRRPALVVVTDGIDHHSVLTFDDLLSIAKQMGAPFFPVGFGDIALPAPVLRRAQSVAATAEFAGIARLGSSHAQAARRHSELEGLARVTGGEFIRGGRSVKRLNVAYEEVIRQLRSYYLVGYYTSPSNAADTKSEIPSWREVEVRVRLPGYQVRTRTGYYHIPIDLVAANRHLQTGIDLISSGETAEALVELNLALQSDPHSWEAYYHRGRALPREGDRQEAQRALLKAADLSPGRGEVHELACRVSLHLEDYEAAWEQAIRAHQAGIDMRDDLLMLRWEAEEPADLEKRLGAPRIYIDSGRLVDPIELAVMQRVSRTLAQELAEFPELGLIDLGTRADYRIQLEIGELSEWRPHRLEMNLEVWESAKAEPERIYRRGVTIFDIEDRERIAADLAPHITEILERLPEQRR